MKVSEIKAVLKPLDVLIGCNLYPGEPTASSHCVSVKKGTAAQAIAAITQAGGRASHAFGPYSESINVSRK